MKTYSLGDPVQIRLEGNWEGLFRDLQDLPRDLHQSVLRGQRTYAEKLIKVVLGHITNQDLGWDPKEHPERSGSFQTLIDTATYLNAITTWQKNYTRYIGIKDGVIEPKSGALVMMVAALHEFKSYSGGPWRALWTPSYEELGKEKGITKAIKHAIVAKLMKKPELSKYVRVDKL